MTKRRDEKDEETRPIIRTEHTHALHDLRFRLDTSDGVQPAGTWRLRYERGRPCATVACPICASPIAVTYGQVAPSGSLDGALACSSDRCRWFEYVFLHGWAETLRGEPPPESSSP